jgi:hypothetical protein
MEEAAATARQLLSLAGRMVSVAAELDRREAWRGGAEHQAWLSRRWRGSATARAWAYVGAKLSDLPRVADWPAPTSATSMHPSGISGILSGENGR